MTRLPERIAHTRTADPAVEAAKDARADLDAAWLRLGTVTPVHAHAWVRTEVGRRAVLLGDERDAVESVLNDLITGRWQP